ncbi:MAG: hypothetical protein J3K34DRAFT_412962 [Monoraphidium minutum]|nr:MAG: hypothetical protein J3K34DRAFT_412962 [Monoraphidium minutum]
MWSFPFSRRGRRARPERVAPPDAVWVGRRLRRQRIQGRRHRTDAGCARRGARLAHVLRRTRASETCVGDAPRRAPPWLRQPGRSRRASVRADRLPARLLRRAAQAPSMRRARSALRQTKGTPGARMARRRWGAGRRSGAPGRRDPPAPAPRPRPRRNPWSPAPPREPRARLTPSSAAPRPPQSASRSAVAGTYGNLGYVQFQPTFDQSNLWAPYLYSPRSWVMGKK